MVRCACNNHFWLQVGSLKGAGSACDENEIGTWIPVLTVNTHRGLPYGPFARLWETCPVNTDKGRAYTSLARHSALVKRCASAGPRFTWPCHRPGELGGEPRAARDSLTAQTRPAPWFATRHPGSRGDTLRSTRGQQVAVLKNTGRKHGTRLGGRGRHGSTQLPDSPARKVTTKVPYLLHTVNCGVPLLIALLSFSGHGAAP